MVKYTYTCHSNHFPKYSPVLCNHHHRPSLETLPSCTDTRSPTRSSIRPPHPGGLFASAFCPRGFDWRPHTSGVTVFVLLFLACFAEPRALRVYPPCGRCPFPPLCGCFMAWGDHTGCVHPQGTMMLPHEWTSSLSLPGLHPEVGLVGQKVTRYLTFRGTTKLFSTAAMHRGSRFSVSSPTLVCLLLKTIATLEGVKWCLVVLIYVSDDGWRWAAFHPPI